MAFSTAKTGLLGGLDIGDGILNGEDGLLNGLDLLDVDDLLQGLDPSNLGLTDGGVLNGVTDVLELGDLDLLDLGDLVCSTSVTSATSACSMGWR